MAAFKNVPEAFRAVARTHPDKTALIYLGARYDFGRLWSLAQAFADSLERVGIGPGDRVLIYLPNSPQWVVAWLGILIRGAVAAPLTPIYPARDLEFAARDSGATAVVCSNANFGYVLQVLPKTNLRTVIHTKASDLLPVWKKVLGVMFDKIPRGRVARGPMFHSFRDLLARGKNRDRDCPASPGDLAEILYTGGTTQAPKGVPFSHELLLDPVEIQLRTAHPVIPPGENTVLLATPLFHILGQTFGLGAMYLFAEKVILMPYLNPDGLMDAIQREKAKSIFAVPSLYRILLEHDRLGLYDLSSLRYCFSGGDVFPGQVGERWRDRLGVSILQGYGATETGGGVSLSPPDRENPPQAAGLPLAVKRLRIVEPMTLRDLPPGKAGELLVGSDPMVSGYWNRPRETAAAFIELDGLLWYRTGDIMRLDEKGYLYFVDRVSDAIYTRGRRVSVSEIEAAIQAHPAVTAACVVGVPDPDPEAGERIKTFVVLKDNQRGLGGQELLDWLGTRLPPHKVPRYVEFRDTLPKSKVGKLLRRELRGEEQQRLKKSEWDEAVKD
ncbi:MAG: AMP-binding protein [Pseudomonadota bacterium]